MPELEAFEISLEDVILDQFEEGKILKLWDINKEKKDSVHYGVRKAKNVVKKIYQLYSRKKKPTRADFLKVFKDENKRMDDDIHNFLEQLDKPDQLLKVVSRKEKNGEVVIKLKRMDDTDRLKIVQSVAKKLASKLSKKDVQSLLEEGIRKRENDTETLKKIDKELDKKDIKSDCKKGCFKIIIGKNEVGIIR